MAISPRKTEGFGYIIFVHAKTFLRKVFAVRTVGRKALNARNESALAPFGKIIIFLFTKRLFFAKSFP